jgi:hypothetical protein
MTNRKEIFKLLKEGITLDDKNLYLRWNCDLKLILKDSLNNHIDENYIFLNFGDSIIFNELEVKLSTNQDRSKNEKLVELGGSLNNNEEAKSMISKFETVLGKPDHYSESYGESFAFWEDDYSKIEIYPRHHMGGEWFEYRIKTKSS